MFNVLKAPILNVNNNNDHRGTISRILRQAGFEVKETDSGQEALKMAAKNPALVILDLHLPDISGFEVCRCIKSNPVTTNIPVLYLSASYIDGQSEMKELESEADSYLTHPIEPVVLIGTVKALLRMYQAEMKALDSSRQWQTTFDAIIEGVCLLDRQGKILQCNRAMMNLLNKPFNEIIGRTPGELVGHNTDPEGSCFGRLKETGRSETFDLPMNDHWFRLRSYPVLNETGNFQGAVQVMVDITKNKQIIEELQQYRNHLEALVDERTNDLLFANEQLQKEINEHKCTEAALKESEVKYSALVEQAKDGVVIVQDGVFTFINQAASEICGYTKEEIVDKPLLDIVAPEYKELISQRYAVGLRGKKNAPSAYEIKIKNKNEATRDVELSVGMIRYQKNPAIMAIVRDVTERKKVEDEMQKIEKIESIGILAGGIAHDFNNILTAIIGNLSLAKLYMKPEEKAFGLLSETEKSTHQARDLTQQLLTFSKGGAPITKILSISELLKDTARFALRGSNVRCEFSVPHDLCPVEIDEGQISQVVNNLIINANQSMPEGGIIKVIAEEVSLNPEDTLPLIKEKKYIKISIKDQGTGIRKNHLRKIFDPYFTTKQKGSGLGLATTYSIIKKHGGHITVESKLGVGTTFFIYLPASQEKIQTISDEKNQLYFGQGKILFMDDEKSVRDMARQMLNHLGYEVKLAKDGAEMIDLYKNAKEMQLPYRAVIMDLTVPGGMGGKKTMKKLLEIDPEVKAIVSSGYSHDPLMSEFRQYGFKDVILKPYKIENLSQTLHKAITTV